MNTHGAPLLNGLRDITMEQWWKDPLIVATALDQKLNNLPVNQNINPALDSHVHQALRLLRAVASRSYGRISMLAVLDLLLAVDYFLVLRDERRDSETHGYDDDAAKLREVFKKHAKELDAFRVWANQQHP